MQNWRKSKLHNFPCARNWKKLSLTFRETFRRFKDTPFKCVFRATVPPASPPPSRVIAILNNRDTFNFFFTTTGRPHQRRTIKFVIQRIHPTAVRHRCVRVRALLCISHEKSATFRSSSSLLFALQRQFAAKKRRSPQNLQMEAS